MLEQEEDLLCSFRMKMGIILLTFLNHWKFRYNNWWCYRKTEKDETKKGQGEFFGGFLRPLAISLVQALISSVVKDISVREIRWSWRGDMDKNV